MLRGNRAESPTDERRSCRAGEEGQPTHAASVPQIRMHWSLTAGEVSEVLTRVFEIPVRCATESWWRPRGGGQAKCGRTAHSSHRPQCHPATVCHRLSPAATACSKLSHPLTTCYRLNTPATACNTLSPPATSCSCCRRQAPRADLQHMLDKIWCGKAAQGMEIQTKEEEFRRELQTHVTSGLHPLSLLQHSMVQHQVTVAWLAAAAQHAATQWHSCMAGSSSTAGKNNIHSCMASRSNSTTCINTLEQLHGWQQQHTRQQHHGTPAWLAQQATTQRRCCMAFSSNYTTGSNTKAMLHGWQHPAGLPRQQHKGNVAWLPAALQATISWQSSMDCSSSSSSSSSSKSSIPADAPRVCTFASMAVLAHAIADVLRLISFKRVN
eukprot:365192-Chlamydomonas_euryale.AAC.33